MQGVAFNALVRLFDAGIGVMQRTDTDFLTGKAHTHAETVFKLE